METVSVSLHIRRRLLTFQRPSTHHELIEYMETSFGFAPHNNSALLEQIPVDVRSCNAAIRCETDSNKLSKSAGVIVALGLCIAKRFKDRVSLEYLSLQQA